ncbi:MAG: hypothetical protein AAGA09_09610 [Pseudomonadota bacterium]
MRIKSKLLAGVVASAFLAGTAGAVDLTNTTGGATNGDPLGLANTLDFAGTTPVTGAVVFDIDPSSGAFPTGNVLVDVVLTGALIATDLTGGELTGSTTSVISTGGSAGEASVRFLISGADGCAPCTVTLPVGLVGTDVSVSVGLETDAGADVDNSNFDDKRVDTDLVSLEDPWAVTFTPDTTGAVADLDLADPFTLFDVALSAGSTTVQDIGDIVVANNQVDYGNGDKAVVGDLAGAALDSTDVAAIDVAGSGSFTAFDDDTTGGALAGDITCGAASCTSITASSFAADLGGTIGTFAFGVEADTETAIESTNVAVEVTIEGDGDLAGTDDFTVSGFLAPISREGTNIVFPWTASATQGAATGSVSIYRFGNIGASATGAIFVEALNASAAGYTSSGPGQVVATIGANGEAVVTAAAVEAAIGNYGRGDLQFSVEETASNVTGRMFVLRNDNLQSIMPGRTDQDTLTCANSATC